ncbi:hypothetical protein [Lysobacter sp. A378]
MAALTFSLLAISMAIGCKPAPAPHPGTSVATPSRPVPTLGPDDAVPRGPGNANSAPPGSSHPEVPAEISASNPTDPLPLTGTKTAPAEQPKPDEH